MGFVFVGLRLSILISCLTLLSVFPFRSAFAEADSRPLVDRKNSLYDALANAAFNPSTEPKTYEELSRMGRSLSLEFSQSANRNRELQESLFAQAMEAEKKGDLESAKKLHEQSEQARRDALEDGKLANELVREVSRPLENISRLSKKIEDCSGKSTLATSMQIPASFIANSLVEHRYADPCLFPPPLNTDETRRVEQMYKAVLPALEPFASAETKDSQNPKSSNAVFDPIMAGQILVNKQAELPADLTKAQMLKLRDAFSHETSKTLVKGLAALSAQMGEWETPNPDDFLQKIAREMFPPNSSATVESDRQKWLESMRLDQGLIKDLFEISAQAPAPEDRKSAKENFFAETRSELQNLADYNRMVRRGEIATYVLGTGLADGAWSGKDMSITPTQISLAQPTVPSLARSLEDRFNPKPLLVLENYTPNLPQLEREVRAQPHFDAVYSGVVYSPIPIQRDVAERAINGPTFMGLKNVKRLYQIQENLSSQLNQPQVLALRCVFYRRYGLYDPKWMFSENSLDKLCKQFSGKSDEEVMGATFSSTLNGLTTDPNQSQNVGPELGKQFIQQLDAAAIGNQLVIVDDQQRFRPNGSAEADAKELSIYARIATQNIRMPESVGGKNIFEFTRNYLGEANARVSVERQKLSAKSALFASENFESERLIEDGYDQHGFNSPEQATAFLNKKFETGISKQHQASISILKDMYRLSKDPNPEESLKYGLQNHMDTFISVFSKPENADLIPFACEFMAQANEEIKDENESKARAAMWINIGAAVGGAMLMAIPGGQPFGVALMMGGPLVTIGIRDIADIQRRKADEQRFILSHLATGNGDWNQLFALQQKTAHEQTMAIANGIENLALAGFEGATLASGASKVVASTSEAVLSKTLSTAARGGRLAGKGIVAGGSAIGKYAKSVWETRLGRLVLVRPAVESAEKGAWKKISHGVMAAGDLPAIVADKVLLQNPASKALTSRLFTTPTGKMPFFQFSMAPRMVISGVPWIMTVNAVSEKYGNKNATQPLLENDPTYEELKAKVAKGEVSPETWQAEILAQETARHEFLTALQDRFATGRPNYLSPGEKALYLEVMAMRPEFARFFQDFQVFMDGSYREMPETFRFASDVSSAKLPKTPTPEQNFEIARNAYQLALRSDQVQQLFEGQNSDRKITRPEKLDELLKTSPQVSREAVSLWKSGKLSTYHLKAFLMNIEACEAQRRVAKVFGIAQLTVDSSRPEITVEKYYQENLNQLLTQNEGKAP